MDLLEAAKQKRQAEKADKFYDEYRDQFDALEKSPLRQVRSIEANDIVVLGEQYQKFDLMHQSLNESGNANLLGTLPTLAYDTITGVYGSSVMPIVSSVQNIEEEQGLVYFKEVVALDSAGNVTAGDILSAANQPPKAQQGYASGKVTAEVIGTGNNTDVTFAGTLAQGTARKQSVKVSVVGESAFYAEDNGEGVFVGRNLVSGTINYDTGAISITWAGAPVSGDIVVDYHENFEVRTDLRQIDMRWTSQLVKAHPYALKGTVGMIQQYISEKRFGRNSAEDMARDLVAEINKEVGNDAIRKLVASAVGNVTFDAAAPSGVSDYAHRQMFKDAIADASRTIATNSGRGMTNVMVAGAKIASRLESLPGFTKLYSGNAVGPHVYGTLDGMTIVRVMDTTVLAEDKIIALWKGPTPWEAPVVYAPFMPLMTTDLLPESPNPLTDMRGAALMAGIESLVPQFATTITYNNL